LKSCKPFGNGHINDTYLVDTDRGSYVLQRVNKNVFRIKELVDNYEVMFNALNDFQKRTGKKVTPALFRETSGKFHFVDDEGFAWRLAELVPRSVSHETAKDTGISYGAAKAMGEFQLFLNTLPLEKISETIVKFHDLPRRYHDFKMVLNTGEAGLRQKAKAEIDKAGEFSFIVEKFNETVGKLPERITHNDTKINNILFAENQMLVIDLDTVMPGLIMNDYGDMVRTFTSAAAEDEKDLDKINFRPEHFEVLTKGYLEPLKEQLTPEEKNTLLTGAESIIYEQALRFLTDYLNGSIYYKTAYPEHNLVRTRPQIKLLEYIVKYETELNRIISQNI